MARAARVATRSMSPVVARWGKMGLSGCDIAVGASAFNFRKRPRDRASAMVLVMPRMWTAMTKELCVTQV